MTLRITPINSIGRKTRDYHGIDFDSDATRLKTKIYYNGNGEARVLSEKYSLEAINQIMDSIDTDKEQTITATPAISKVSKDRVWLTDHNEKYNNIETPDYGNSDAYALRYCLAQSHATGWCTQAGVNTFDINQSLNRVIISNLDTPYRYASIDLSGGPVVFTFNDMPEKQSDHYVTVQWFDMFGKHVGFQHICDGDTTVAVCKEGDSVDGVDHTQILPETYGVGLVRVQRIVSHHWTAPTANIIGTRTADNVSMWNVNPNDYGLPLNVGTSGESVRYMLNAMDPDDFTAYTDKLLEYIIDDLNDDDTAIANEFANSESITQSFRVNVVETMKNEQDGSRLSNGWVRRTYEDYNDSDWMEAAFKQRNGIWLLPLNLDSCGVEYGTLYFPNNEFYFTMPTVNASYFWSFTVYNKLNYMDSTREYIGSQLGLTPGPDGYKIFVTRNRPANLDNAAGEYWLPTTDTSHRVVYRVYGSDGNRVENISKITLL